MHLYNFSILNPWSRTQCPHLSGIPIARDFVTIDSIDQDFNLVRSIHLYIGNQRHIFFIHIYYICIHTVHSVNMYNISLSLYIHIYIYINLYMQNLWLAQAPSPLQSHLQANGLAATPFPLPLLLSTRSLPRAATPNCSAHRAATTRLWHWRAHPPKPQGLAWAKSVSIGHEEFWTWKTDGILSEQHGWKLHSWIFSFLLIGNSMLHMLFAKIRIVIFRTTMLFSEPS